jgi:outer membrane protein insertion porin family
VEGRAKVALGALLAVWSVVAWAQPEAVPSAEPLVVSVSYSEEAGPRDFVEGLITVRKGQRLSRQTVQRSIERLFATGRYSDVVVEREDVPGGVALVFDITLKKTLARITVDGAQEVAPKEVLAASKLVQGSEYYAERLDAAEREVKALYERRGYTQAVVNAQLDESEGGLDVTLLVVEGQPRHLAEVVFGGGPGLPVRQLMGALGLKLGDVLDLDVLNAGIERLRGAFRAARFYRAQVGQPVVEVGPKGARVSVFVLSGPQYAIQFHGNRSFSGKVLEDILHYDGSESLDPDLMVALAKKVATFYRYRGFYDVDVSAHETPSPTHQRALLVFEVQEGDPLFVRDITFSGNTALSASQLKDVVVDRVAAKAPVTLGEIRPTDDPMDLEGQVSKPPARAEPEPDPSSVYVDDAYLEAAQAMEQIYRDRGFSKVSVSLSQVRIDAQSRAATVHFDIHEGGETRIADIQLPGWPEGVASTRASGLDAGDVLDGSALDRARAALLRVLGRAGYVFARVNPQPGFSNDGRLVHLVFQIESGPQVKVGKIIVQGAGKREPYVRANMAVHEGTVLDPETLFESQKNVVNMGDFSQVTVHLIAPDTAEAVKDVVVEVSPAAQYGYGAGVGYTLVEGPLVQADISGPDVGQTMAAGLNSLTNVFRGGAEGQDASGFDWLKDALAETSFTARGRVSYVGYSALAIGVLGQSAIISDPSVLAGWRGFGGRANLALQHPLIYALVDHIPGKLGWRLDVVAERIFRPSYRFYRGAVVASLEWAYHRAQEPDAWLWLGRYLQSGRYGLTFQAEPEYVVVRTEQNIDTLLATLAPADQARLRFPQGNFTLINLRVTPTADFRDDPANPHQGLVVSFPTEYTHAISAQETDSSGVPLSNNGPFIITTAKLAGNVTQYVPFGPKWVLALSLRGGGIIRLNPNSQTIPPKRFYLGGSTTMRGFGEDQVIPEDQRELFAEDARNCAALASKAGCTVAAQTVLAGNQIPPQGGELFELAKAELRFPFPLLPSWDTGLFFEAGNLYLNQSPYDFIGSLYTLRYDAGFSFRKPTPIGALALGLGFNLNAARDAIRSALSLAPVSYSLNETIWNFNFSVGQF